MSNATDAPLDPRDPSVAARFFAAATGEEPATSETPAAAAGEPQAPEPTPQADPAAEPQGPTRDARGRFASNSSDAEPVAAEAAPEEPATQEGEVAEDDGPTTVASLAAELEIDQDTFLSLVHVERDGATVSLQDAITEQAAHREQFQAERAQWETQRQQDEQSLYGIAAQFNNQIEDLSKAALGVRAMLEAGPSEAELLRIKDEDPGRYADELQRRHDMEQRLQSSIAEVQKAHQVQEQAQRVQHEQWLARENQALLRSQPDLADPATRQNVSQQLTTFLGRQGFTPDEISGFSDHRFIILARKAMELESIQQAAPKTRERLQKLPKLTRPQARAPEVPQEARVKRDAWDRLRSSGGKDRDAAAALFTNLIEGEG